MDTNLAVAGMEKSFSGNPAMDVERTMDLSIDQDARRWLSLNQNTERFAKDLHQMSNQFNGPISGSNNTRSQAPEGAQGQPYIYQRASSMIVRRGAQAMLDNVATLAIPEKPAKEKQEQRSQPSLSNAPQTKAEQQRSALQKLSRAITGEIKSSSSAEPVDLEDLVLRILHKATDSVKWDDRHPQGVLNHNAQVTLTKGEALKASQAISNLIRQSPGSTYTVQRRFNPGSFSNAKVCPKCSYAVARDCDLRKHMKRHEKPYGCTYPKCHKRFGAKSDWKRHENSQHFQLEAFRCAQPASSCPETVCGQHFFRVKQFEEHLNTQHNICNSDQLKDEVRMCTIGKNCQGRFWCGFCKIVTELKEKRNAAWDERFDHIAHHFEKERKTIDDWVCADENKTKRELLKEMDRYVFDDDEERSVEAVDEAEEDIITLPPNMVPEQSGMPRIQGPPPPPPQQPSQGTLSSKRKGSDVEVQRPAKRNRITTLTTLTTRLCVSLDLACRVTASNVGSVNARQVLGRSLCIYRAWRVRIVYVVVAQRMYMT